MLKVEQISYKSLIKKISFTVDAGETVGIVGPSGSGKTLTAHAVMGFIKPESGAILWESQNLLTMNSRQLSLIRGAEMGMVFQDPMTALNPTMRIHRQIGEALRTRDINAIRLLLEEVGIPENRMYDYPHQFSGGMRQRIVIAMAIARNPKLLIADEPTTALDAVTQMKILELLKSLTKQRKMGLLLISHNLEVVRFLCERIILLQNGSIIADGKVGSILQTAHPQVVGLLQARSRLQTSLA